MLFQKREVLWWGLSIGHTVYAVNRRKPVWSLTWPRWKAMSLHPSGSVWIPSHQDSRLNAGQSCQDGKTPLRVPRAVPQAPYNQSTSLELETACTSTHRGTPFHPPRLFRSFFHWGALEEGLREPFWGMLQTPEDCE